MGQNRCAAVLCRHISSNSGTHRRYLVVLLCHDALSEAAKHHQTGRGHAMTAELLPQDVDSRIVDSIVHELAI
jgi:hypothetical protein